MRLWQRRSRVHAPLCASWMRSVSSFAPDPALHRLSDADAGRLAEFLGSSLGTAVITGAGVSTESGIPDYRGEKGSYSQGHKPMQHHEFVSKPSKRKRYWARSLVGWKYFDGREPNVCHYSLAALEETGAVSGIVTQNVDHLHTRAGSMNVVELHGRNDRVRCLRCDAMEPRRLFQERVQHLNGDWISAYLPDASEDTDFTRIRADGDAHLDDSDFSMFRVPRCTSCDYEVVMPDLVFFGGSIESSVKDAAAGLIDDADRLLVLGSSCQVYSAFRLVRAAVEQHKPVAIVNIGETRVDSLASFTVDALCSDALRCMCASEQVQISTG